MFLRRGENEAARKEAQSVAAELQSKQQEVQGIETEISKLEERRNTLMERMKNTNKQKSKLRDQLDAVDSRGSPPPPAPLNSGVATGEVGGRNGRALGGRGVVREERRVDERHGVNDRRMAVEQRHGNGGGGVSSQADRQDSQHSRRFDDMRDRTSDARHQAVHPIDAWDGRDGRDRRGGFNRHVVPPATVRGSATSDMRSSAGSRGWSGSSANSRVHYAETARHGDEDDMDGDM